MNLAAWATRYRPIVITVVFLLMAWGVVSFLTMPRREDPEFTIRTCVVTTVWTGAPAQKVEELITDPLETVLDGIEEVETLTSTTITGQSTINVELGDDIPVVEIQNVWDKVRARVATVTMPDRDISPRVNDEFGDTTIYLIAIYQEPSHGRDFVRPEDAYTPRELEIFTDRIRDALRLLPGVAKVEKYGVQQEAIYVQTDLETWSTLELTTNELAQLVEQRNIVESGGSVDTASGRVSIFPLGELNAVNELASIVIGGTDTENVGTSVQTASAPVTLANIGLDVVRAYESPAKYIVRYGDAETSAPAVVLGLTMKSGGNIVTVADSAKARLKRLIEEERALPDDIAVTPVSDQSENVTAKINDVVSNVVSAIVIVVIVVLIMVGLRTALVMAANIPVVVLASVAVITLFGVQLEQISLASIIIALGLLVDNAVQVCDQARTNQLRGMKPTEAAVAGARTLAAPMLMGTLTTIAAFFPMLFALEGSSAEFIYSLPVTLSVTLGLSWVLAMTFCVILAAAFIRAGEGSSGSPLEKLGDMAGRFFSKKKKSPGKPPETQPPTANDENIILRMYGVFAGVAIKAKWLTLAAAVALFFVAVGLPVKSEFFPQDRRDQFAIKIFLPEMATIEQADEKAKQVEAIVRALDKGVDENGEPVSRLRAMRTIVGGGGSRWHLSWAPEPPAPFTIEMLVRTTDGRFTPQYAADVRRLAEIGDESLGLKPVVGARVTPVELPLGPPTDPIVIRVSGDGFADMAKLRSIAGDVEKLVRARAEAWNVTNSWGASSYQLAVDVDAEKANRAGLTNMQIAQSLNSYFSGRKLSEFREGDHVVPVYFRLAPDERQSLDGLRTAFIEGANGKVPLNSVANLDLRWLPGKIERRNRNRTIEVSARTEPGASGNDVVLALMASSEMKSLVDSLPSGFAIEVGGALEESAESSVQMLTSFGISLVSIILLLVIQYNGWAKPLIVLATLPMALIGALPGLYFSDNPMGFMPQLGILSLFGIVLNTGIIFIEFADILLRQAVDDSGKATGPISGLTKAEFRNCLVQAGKQRMLPIFLTTATTIGGLVPLALDGGPLWTGLAWSMIYGLAVATLLTLFVVPALYAILVETFGVQPISANSAEESAEAV